MLRQLHIRDFAIIEELQLEFAPGFNVLTGETGAGKSIIMQALDLVCGGRASPEDIRAGADEASIEGIFDLSDEESALLAELGFARAGDLHVRRILSRGGKSRVLLNGSSSAVAVLAQIGERLIHVYGQHEQSLLLRPESHLDLLDAYAAHADLLAEMAARHSVLEEAARRLARLRGGRAATEQRAELLRFQLQELDAAAFQPGEDEELRREKDILTHAERLQQISRQGEEALYSGDEALITGLGRVGTQLREAMRIDPSFGEIVDLLEVAQAQVQEAADRLRDASERLAFDPERREAVEERWALLQRLLRKHGGSLEAMLRQHGEIAAELRGLEGDGLDLEAVERQVADAAELAWKAAAALSESRRRKAKALKKSVTKELQALGMKGSVFSVAFGGGKRADTGDPFRGADGIGLGRTGADSAEFHFSGNVGEPPRPLARVASGGELSRIMLALKVLTAGRGEVSTLVFDEVDAGIGGTIADAVGVRLTQLGEGRQVLCITHLPQIAAGADHHFVVEKRVRQGRTVSAARQLDRDARIAELSRMLGGAADAEAERYARRLVATRRGS